MARYDKIHRAKSVKDNEFYTRYETIEKGVDWYGENGWFKDKIIYCPCDDPSRSQFWKYFKDNFVRFGLKGLWASWYIPINEAQPDYMPQSFIMTFDGQKEVLKQLNENGDVLSDEIAAYIQQPNVIVVTNPPFSLFRQIFNRLMGLKAKFLLLGSNLVPHYKDVLKELIEGNVFIGKVYDESVAFNRPDWTIKKCPIGWYSNICYCGVVKHLELSQKYDEKLYRKIDGTDVLYIERSKDVPVDYYGLIGVPIAFMKFWNRDEFELVDIVNNPIVDGKIKFKRLAVKRKQ